MYSGLLELQIYDPILDNKFPAIVQYPTMQSPMGTTIGPYYFDSTINADVAPGKFPVCMISHGGGGSHLVYRTITTYLAKNGFISVSLEHPGDNRNDNSLMNTDTNAINRPRHASLAIDAVLEDSFFAHSITPSEITAVGHSMGGYTVLALAGGQPWSRSGQSLAVKRDCRIKAAVLMAPSTDWYMAPNSLDAVSIPILILAGEKDQFTPLGKIQQAFENLPQVNRNIMRVIENAGHFSFLSPFPAYMCRPDFPPSVDPKGFDREGFHKELPKIIEQFLS